MRIDVFTLFPDLVDEFCAESLLGKARQRGPRRPALPRPARAHDRRAPHRRRRPVRRWRRHADAAGADLRVGRGRRPAASAVPARSRWAAVRPGWPTSWRRVDGFSLLCGRYEGVDHRVREHLVDGELSVGDVVLSGGRGGRLPGDRGRHPPARRCDGQRRQPGDRELRRRPACSRSRTSRVRPTSAAGRCPRCCAAATTPGSPAGARRRRCTARCATGPT